MTAQIIPMTDAALALSTARAVLRRPGQHEDRHLRAACVVLADLGDWVDAERARAMQAQLEREARAAVEDRLWAEARARKVAQALTAEPEEDEEPSAAELVVEGSAGLVCVLVIWAGVILGLVGLGGLR